MQHCRNDREKLKYLEKKPVPLPICLPQILQGLALDQTQTSVVSGQGLTTCAMAFYWTEISTVGKLVIDHTSYGMAFPTRRVSFYSSASHSWAHSLWAAGIIWKRVCFIELYYQCLDLTNKISVCPLFVGLFIICVPCPAVHKRSLRTHNCLVLMTIYVGLKSKELTSWKLYSCSAGFKPNVAQ